MYALKDGKLTWNNDNKIPYESASPLLYYIDESQNIIVPVFENKENKLELLVGKSDYGIIGKLKSDKSNQNEVNQSKVNFINTANSKNEELPEMTAIREGFEETDEQLIIEPNNRQVFYIETSPHKSWIDETKELKTLVGIVPVEINKEQLNLLKNTKFNMWVGVKMAKLKLNKSDNSLCLATEDGIDLFAKDSINNLWRGFFKTLFKFYPNDIEKAFRHVANHAPAPSLTQAITQSGGSPIHSTFEQEVTDTVEELTNKL